LLVYFSTFFHIFFYCLMSIWRKKNYANKNKMGTSRTSNVFIFNLFLKIPIFFFGVSGSWFFFCRPIFLYGLSTLFFFHFDKQFRLVTHHKLKMLLIKNNNPKLSFKSYQVMKNILSNSKISYIYDVKVQNLWHDSSLSKNKRNYCMEAQKGLAKHNNSKGGLKRIKYP